LSGSVSDFSGSVFVISEKSEQKDGQIHHTPAHEVGRNRPGLSE
jgi:hypothetical protein